MATSYAALTAIVRRHLLEVSAAFWSDDEIAALLGLGAKDLAKKINHLKQKHFVTIEDTSLSLPANCSTLSYVPSDLIRLDHLEPKSLTQFTNLFFRPLDFKDAKFMAARAQSAVDPINLTLWYDILHEGAPVNAPTIWVAPQVTSPVPLRMLYVPTLTSVSMTTAGTNPIPGESDNALICWAVAYGRAKEREDRSPDPEWLALYATEKDNLVSSLEFRQDAEEKVVTPNFEAYWDN